MSNITMWGFPNHTAQAYTTAATIGGGIEPADMVASWLKTDEPKDIARITTLDPYASQWGFDTNLVPLTIDALALVNHNIADGGQIRFVGWGGSVVGILNLPTMPPPQTVVASTNMTGAVGDIDETISASDGLSMAPTNPALPWSVTLRFFSLGGTINTGADMMAIVIRTRRVFTGAGASDPRTLPIVTAALAAPTFALGYRAVTVSTTGGQIFIFPFRRSDFTSVADCQVKLDFTPGTSFSGGQYAVLETVACYYDAVTVNSPTHDSGWVTWQTNSLLARVAPTQHMHYIPPTPWTNIIAYGVQLRSDQSIHVPLKTAAGLVPAPVVPTNPLTFVQAGVAPAGPAIAPAAGVRKGAGPMSGSPETVSVGGTTGGGQAYGADAYGFRTSPPLELIVTRDELLLLQDQLGFRKGKNSPFYVAVEPGVAQQYQMFTAYWATLKSMSEPRPLGRYKADGTMKFSVEVAFQEKI